MSLFASDMPQFQMKKRKLMDLEAQAMQEAKTNIKNYKSPYIDPEVIFPTAAQTHSKMKLTPKIISAGELRLMSNNLQKFQRDLEPLTHLSERLLLSGILQPGDIHSIISRFSGVQSKPGQSNSRSKMKSNLPLKSKTELNSGSIAKQLDLYFKQSKLDKKVEDREEFIKILTVFMEHYVAFKGCIEILLRSAENRTTDEAQDHKGWSSDTSESDSSEQIYKMLVPNLK
ncbi:uncharacterized protein MELLADRAFT_60534 [Melampsora larici-populina 98AG31]|uniref:Uncharacterized protein n=1 Tax=Melampsora larici-populina (strain 98AG31 / pathotype 3-4-7) TaxID=747676 RepID=F4RBJ1_MELLP|nr:uncharacterized protein MELLADRAFT_60534 [Melampsora larici-populina 98AG31]EGG10351.1 hypothetical protein MELLADRAFT_60534 [Melampsora larici-populina 98AG31]